MTPADASPHGRTPYGHTSQGRRGIAVLLARLLINLAAPVLVYVLLRPHVHSDVTALVAGAAVPVGCTAGVLLWRRRLDAIGVFAVGCFAIGLLLVVATGGNELAFKLREDIWTGPLGLACLISVLVRRPLFSLVLRFAARRNAQIAMRADDPHLHRISTVTTSTAIFLTLKVPINLVIVGGGLVALVWWIRRQYRDRWDQPPNPGASHPGPVHDASPSAPAGPGPRRPGASRAATAADGGNADGNNAHPAPSTEER